MIDGKLQDFVSNVIARGRITFGDVRRLQRRYLPNGLTRRDDVEMLISLNGQLDRADKAWAEWLTAAVTDSARREDCGPAIEDAAASAVERLLASAESVTKLGQRIARQIRRELVALRSHESMAADPPLADELAELPVSEIDRTARAPHGWIQPMAIQIPAEALAA